MKKICKYYVVVFGFSFFNYGFTQSPASSINKKVDDFIHTKMIEHHIGGLSLAVMREGKIIHSKGYGYSNLEHQVPVKQNTAFAIASITKSFTSIAVMMLVERGKISLDDPIDQHLMELPSAWKEITIQQLLNHTSGIPGFAHQKKIECTFGKQVRDYVRGDGWKEVACLPLLFAPGEQWSYGDTGYYLLGMLIEKISKMKYEEFMQKNIFLPLNMNNSCLISYTELIPNRADGYAFRNGKYYLAPRFEFDEFSNGGLVSTARDLIQMHVAFTSEILLKKQTWNQMWSKAVLKNDSTVNYGLGFGLTPFQSRKRIGHYGGGGLGFASGLTHFTKENLTVVVLSNTDNEEIGSLVNMIASFYFNNKNYKDFTPKIK